MDLPAESTEEGRHKNFMHMQSIFQHTDRDIESPETQRERERD